MTSFGNYVFNVPGFHPFFYDWFRTGSRVIGGATPESDIDIVCIFTEELHNSLVEFGYQSSYKNLELDKLRYPNVKVTACLRKDDYNIIMVEDRDTYDKWWKFTKLAQMLQLTEKHQRVALAQFITEGLVRGTDIVY